MQKLKSALRRRRESNATDRSDGAHHHGETGSPRVSQQFDSPRVSQQFDSPRVSQQFDSPRASQSVNDSEERPRRMSVHSKPVPQSASRSRPLSSAGNPLAATSGAAHAPKLQSTGLKHAETSSQETIPGSMAKDYNTYVAALSPKTGNESEHQTTRGNDRRVVSGQNERRPEGDLADRNASRQRASMDAGARKPLPALPLASNPVAKEPITSRTLPNDGNTLSPVNTASPNAPTGDYVVSRDVETKQGLVDGILHRTDGSDHDKSHYRRSDWPLQPSHDEGGMQSKGKGLHASNNYDDDLPQPPAPLKVRSQVPTTSQHRPVDFQPAVVDGRNESEEHRQLRLKGVVDLRSTVDTDADVHWTPAVTHELIKPHKHEVIQHKIYREIHNYDVYHRIQPVIHTEVLPPRHWIPNPNGEGLLEINAEELPARTGDNRWWSIVQHEPAPITYEREWRTQPQIIKGKSVITAEGFKRKETTILHPPTLASLAGYDGLVQPVHFDHKTGERWWGEITTMDKVKEQSDRPHHSETPLNLDGLAEALPKVPSSPPQKRKPVSANTASGVY